MQKLTLSTADLPQHLDDQARFRIWRDTYCEWVGATDLWRPDEGAFVGRWDFGSLGDVLLSKFSGTKHSVGRTQQQVSAAPQDRYFLSINVGPTELGFSQSQRDYAVATGQALLFSGTEAHRCDGASGWVGIGLPKPVLRQLVPDVDGIARSVLDGSTPVMRHLRRYLTMLMESDDLGADPRLMAHIETNLQDLMALALAAAGDAAMIAQTRGLRAVRCAEILREIDRGFADPAFSAQRIAAKIGVSPSYVQKLLHDTGTSLTERVLELRLQQARRMLADRRNDKLKVSDIALSCGFNEISYFNRSFRRRFGDTPLGYRGRAGDRPQ